MDEFGNPNGSKTLMGLNSRPITELSPVVGSSSVSSRREIVSESFVQALPFARYRRISVSIQESTAAGIGGHRRGHQQIAHVMPNRTRRRSNVNHTYTSHLAASALRCKHMPALNCANDLLRISHGSERQSPPGRLQKRTCPLKPEWHGDIAKPAGNRDRVLDFERIKNFIVEMGKYGWVKRDYRRRMFNEVTIAIPTPWTRGKNNRGLLRLRRREAWPWRTTPCSLVLAVGIISFCPPRQSRLAESTGTKKS